MHVGVGILTKKKYHLPYQLIKQCLSTFSFNNLKGNVAFCYKLDSKAKIFSKKQVTQSVPSTKKKKKNEFQSFLFTLGKN